MTEDFEKATHFDPLLEAEKITGKSYSEDEETSALGFLLVQARAKYLRDEFSIRDDTYRNIPFLDGRRIFGELGFEEVYEETYTAFDRPETYLILWHPKGVLAVTHSHTTLPEFGGSIMDGATLYGNWLSNEGVDRWKYTSSGSLNRITPGFDGTIPEDPWVWVGNWPGGEGLRNLMDRLDNNGTWLPVWQIQPSLHLDNFEQAREYQKTRSQKVNEWLDQVRARRAQRIALLPEYVQNAIRGLKEV